MKNGDNMSNNHDTAMQFFDACETGKGWGGCNEFCHPDATFSSQTSALADISTLDAYCEWMKNLLITIPDGQYELKFFAADEARNSVLGYGVLHGTHTGEGGPVPPTGKTVAADYVYHMEFEAGLVKHVTKIWNDTITLQQLGWS
ncbi:MAG: putative ester cyclase [Colwellia sp.]|jgi:predicted ester cyclase